MEQQWPQRGSEARGLVSQCNFPAYTSEYSMAGLKRLSESHSRLSSHQIVDRRICQKTNGHSASCIADTSTMGDKAKEIIRD